MSDPFSESKPTEEKPASVGVAAGMRVTWQGMIVNLLLMVLKLWVGFASRSQALIADGVHSLSDLFSDFVVLLGLRWGRQAEDEDHPFGHGRIETISGMVVGLLLLVVGIGIAYSAIETFATGKVVIPTRIALVAAGVSIVLKEALYWYTIRVGRQLRSMALIANAWHHRSDALSSVAVFVGVGAAIYNPDWYLADAVAALVVTFFIMKVGLNLVWAAFRELADTAPDQQVLDQLRVLAGRVEGVRQVHDMRTRHSGSQIFVEIHIVVDAELTVREGHAISRNVKHLLLDEVPDVTRVIVHVDPEMKANYS